MANRPNPRIFVFLSGWRKKEKEGENKKKQKG
jgi:hypothetical protein